MTARRLRSRAGQIVIPAMLIFPTLFLFVYLIYETAKLSREKIRHQFAMDAAAFVEMTNYSDFLNRTAYVNGAFPMRIFEEGYGDFPAECEGHHDPCPPVEYYPPKASYADVLYKNSAFPRSLTGKHTYGTEGSWDIAYPEPKNGGGSAPQLNEPYELFTLHDAEWLWHQWDLATEIYKLWVQIYSLLGSVEDAQFSVLKRLSGDHSFMKKSYWLNTGDPINDAAGLAKSFDVALGDFNSAVKPYCQRKLIYWGNRHLGGTGLQPIAPFKTDPVVDLPTSAACSQGVFQIMYVEPNTIKKLRDKNGDYPGLLLWMNWAIPQKNYWNIDFPTLMNHAAPNGTLRTTISLQGDPANKPAVWPYPTPKFQVRQFP
ncbi:MAG: hypothetical protein HY079_08985 [Elusimicrobia bacterium]|nr:hypothetical protein [Elusimicrobiota bacterium]